MADERQSAKYPREIGMSTARGALAGMAGGALAAPIAQGGKLTSLKSLAGAAGSKAVGGAATGAVLGTIFEAGKLQGRTEQIAQDGRTNTLHPLDTGVAGATRAVLGTTLKDSILRGGGAGALAGGGYAMRLAGEGMSVPQRAAVLATGAGLGAIKGGLAGAGLGAIRDIGRAAGRREERMAQLELKKRADAPADVPGLLAEMGPPGEWSGAVASTVSKEQRLALLRAWRSMSAEERNTLLAKWRERFNSPKDKTAEVEYRGRTFPGYNQPVTSDNKDKKMMVLAKKGEEVRLIHFGQRGYKHNYSPEAKQNYLARSAGIRDKSGQLTKDDPFSPNYWARRVLWPKGETGDGKNGPVNTEKAAAALPLLSKEKREAAHHADQHFRSSDPAKWDDFLENAKRKSFVAAVRQDTRADPKLERHVDQMNRLLTGKEVGKVKIGDGGEYSIVRLRGGGLGCTCADWRYKKSVAPSGDQDCKHVAAWRAKSSAKTASAGLGLGAGLIGLRHVRGSKDSGPSAKSVALHEAIGLGVLAGPYVAHLAAVGAEALSHKPGRIGAAARATHSVLHPIADYWHGSRGHGVVSATNELVGLGILARPSIQELNHMRKQQHA